MALLSALGASPVGGRGVFATADFREEEIVEICPSIEVHADDVGGKLCDYVFYGSDENQRVVVLGYGMMYNSSAVCRVGSSLDRHRDV